MTRVRTAVLASGGGSNLQAILDHAARLGDARAFDVVLVASDRPGAGALERARRAGIPTGTIRTPRNPEGRDVIDLLEAHDIGLVVLAGYLRLIPADVTARFGGSIVNVHPAPLPQFGGAGMYGQRVHRAVIESRATSTGPTVHLVDEIYDHGQAIAHWPVPVLASDDEHALAARVLRAEHLLFPRVVQRMAQARAMAPDDQVFGTRHDLPHLLRPFDPELDDAALAQQVDAALAR
jgi:phosphoribosylglycinamide formyltransferase 1